MAVNDDACALLLLVREKAIAIGVQKSEDIVQGAILVTIRKDLRMKSGTIVLAKKRGEENLGVLHIVWIRETTDKPDNYCL